ncbi:hyaluronan synthase [Sporomusaceae bacterium FL31]|nr:Hyaluronan synthase [Sporomusaceae bacterium FL31]GCE34881.1 hyaluronan synthase [Sporomusaceae bacterium]
MHQTVSFDTGQEAALASGAERAGKWMMNKLFQQEIKEEETDILLVDKPDRRLLSNVPDKEGLRTNIDRRRVKGNEDEFASLIEHEKMGKRYLVDYAVEIQYVTDDKTVKCHGKGVDISTTGMLLEVSPEIARDLSRAVGIQLKFVIAPGTMPEGYEMSVNVGAKYIRSAQNVTGETVCGVTFLQSLAQYAAKKKNWYMLSAASLFLFFITACILLMRAESVLYFKFNKALYLYSIIAATFLLTRYLFGSFYRPVPIDKDFTPGVTIIIPCFNEEEWIQKTIAGCVNQDYPIDKLEVIVVDDSSTDQSFAKIQQFADELKIREARYEISTRLHYVRQEQNAGKREALARGTLMAKHELVVFVDSDSFLDPFAIRNLVQPFKDNQMGGVSGRTDVANTYTNALTKMQAVRYYIAFRIMKAAESYFDAVTCLSGPLSCYRKDLVLQFMEPWLSQTFLGEKATFGDDRSMTNFILRKHRTGYQDTAICNTIVPNNHRIFLKQQMRWKRSWLRESLIAASFMWKKEPFMALSFYMGVLVPLLAPIIVLYNLLYIPITHRVFPITFIIGIALMALLMSMTQLLLRKSSTWIYGLWFCLYYEAVLLWQMPIAWVTFWKTTWGTRMTPADLLEALKKNRGKQTGA